MPEYGDDLTGLIRDFQGSRFSTLEVSSEGLRVRLKRRAAAGAPAPQPAVAEQPQGPAWTPVPAAALARGEEPRAPVDPTGALVSPRVGRFFELQDALGQPVLRTGVRLQRGQIYGIIESMHLRYEIRSEKDGIVERVLVPSGEPVEFGQSLVLLQS